MPENLQKDFKLDSSGPEDVEPYKWDIPLAKFGYKSDSEFLSRNIKQQHESFQAMRGRIMFLFDQAKGMDVTSFDNIWDYFNLDHNNLREEPIGKALIKMGFSDENMQELQDAANMSKIKYFVLDFNRQNTDYTSQDLDTVYDVYTNATSISQVDGKYYITGNTGQFSEDVAEMIARLFGTVTVDGNEVPSDIYESRASVKHAIESALGPDNINLNTPDETVTSITNAFANTNTSFTVPGLTYNPGGATDIYKRGFSKLTIQQWHNTFIEMLDIRFKRKTSWWKRLLAIVLIIIAVVIFVLEVISGFSDGGQGSLAVFTSAVKILSSGYTVYSMLTQYFESPIIEETEEEQTAKEEKRTIDGVNDYSGLYEWNKPYIPQMETSRPEYEDGKPDALLERGNIYAN